MKNTTVVALGVAVALVFGYCGRWGWLQRDAALRFQERAVAAETHVSVLRTQIDELIAQADAAEKQVPVAPVPEPCKPYVEPLRRANLTLHQALAKALESRDTLASALASRPKPRVSRFVGPNVGVGAFVGLCGVNQLCAGVGLTLNLGGIRP